MPRVAGFGKARRHCSAFMLASNTMPPSSTFRPLLSSSDIGFFIRHRINCRALSTTPKLFNQPPKEPLAAVANKHTAPPTAQPHRQPNQLRVWPFVLIFVSGSLLFVQIVKSRAGTGQPASGSYRQQNRAN